MSKYVRGCMYEQMWEMVQALARVGEKVRECVLKSVGESVLRGM